MKRVLILGGTGDAAQLAARAVALPGVKVITSLAERVRQPATSAGRMHIGGFGGVAGLIDYVWAQHIDLLIDVTYLFATLISHHVVDMPLTPSS
jgi:precorrin-6A/cobalt-precorrin-6A reductase